MRALGPWEGVGAWRGGAGEGRGVEEEKDGCSAKRGWMVRVWSLDWLRLDCSGENSQGL